jgi:hypothetical protein
MLFSHNDIHFINPITICNYFFLFYFTNTFRGGLAKFEMFRRKNEGPDGRFNWMEMTHRETTK